MDVERFEGGRKRLLSLDEFEPPAWHQQARRASGANMILIVALGLAIGGVLGSMLFT